MLHPEGQGEVLERVEEGVARVDGQEAWRSVGVPRPEIDGEAWLCGCDRTSAS